MRRLMCVILALCLSLAGCGVISDQQAVGEKVPTSKLDMSLVNESGRMDTLAVYFLNTNNTLTAEPRKLMISQDINPAEAAVKALLVGPSNDSVTSVAKAGMTLDFIEYSNNVANVYIEYIGTALQTEDAFTLEQAIANTVTDILGASSICVFYNGVRKGFGGYPSAPLRKHTGNVHDAYLSAYGKYIPQPPVTNPDSKESISTEETKQTAPTEIEIQTVLYFLDASGDYILPEVRTVKYTPGRFVEGEYVDGNYIETIINELKKGPQNTSVMKAPLTSDSALIRPPVMTDNNIGGYDLDIALNSLMPGTSKEVALSCAAIIYSITGFVPNIENVYITADNSKLTGEFDGAIGGAKRRDYFGTVGNSAPVYFEDKNSDLLLEVSRSMEQSQIWSARARLNEMIRGPIEGDNENVSAVILVGITQDDILEVIVNEDTAYVNLSQNFQTVCQGIDAREEMLIVYAMVNTITAVDGISKVQFLVEGRQVETLAGHICLTDPFLKNYGIIKNGS